MQSPSFGLFAPLVGCSVNTGNEWSQRRRHHKDDSAQGSCLDGIRLPNGRNDSPGPIRFSLAWSLQSLHQLGRRTQMEGGFAGARQDTCSLSCLYSASSSSSTEMDCGHAPA
jgi:hypothetical protein